MPDQGYGYQNRQGVLPISWEMFHAICKSLAQAAVQEHPELVLPVGRGGYYPGTLLSHMLQLELFPVRLSRRVADVRRYDEPRWILRPPRSIRGKRILVVDEICSTGETIEMVKGEVYALGATSMCSAVLYAHSHGATIPDYIGIISDALFLNPWDREILVGGRFQWHPEYAEALALQGLEPREEWLQGEQPVRLAKGESSQTQDGPKAAPGISIHRPKETLDV